jgi:protease-4
MFVADLRERRGNKLKAGVDYGTGEIWSGQQAHELGLVDELGTIDVIAEREKSALKFFGPGGKTYTPFATEMKSWFSDIIQSALQRVIISNSKPSLN